MHSTLLAVLLVAVTAVFGRVVYSAHISTWITLIEFLVMLIVGAAASSCGSVGT